MGVAGGRVTWSEVVLVIDASEEDVTQVAELLADKRRIVHRAHSLREGLALMETVDVDLVLASLELPAMPGPAVVRMLRELRQGMKVVALTASPDPAVAVTVVRAGAEDYLGKPVSPALLKEAVGRALGDIVEQRALAETRDMVRDRYGFHDILSRSPRMVKVFEQIRSVAPTDATVLVLGETGTGKELVARAIHDGSGRAEAPYISVNCGAFSEGLLDSELFGHERGSFTGAVERRVGVFELADGGTLFLDELGQTSLGVQVNLLRVLEDLSFRRVGGEKQVKVDVRIVAATNTDLDEAVVGGTFREDLYYRLNVFPIRLPPLRERREDIPLLLRHFLDGAARDYGLKPPRVSSDAMHWITHYRWPGNVRQLRAMAERWVIVAQGRTLLKEMLPANLVRPAPGFDSPSGMSVDAEAPLGTQLERLQGQFERAYLHKVLAAHQGQLQRAAAHAGISRRTLYTKMKQYGLDPATYRRD